MAARSSLRCGHIMDRPRIPELKYITSFQLFNLYNYWRKCLLQAKSVTQAVGNGFTASTLGCDIVMREFTFWACRRHGATCAQQTTIIYSSNSSEYPAQWWVSYMNDAAAALDNGACSEVVKSVKLLDATAAKALNCHTCRGKARVDIGRFSEILANAIEARISTVIFIYFSSNLL